MRCGTGWPRPPVSRPTADIRDYDHIHRHSLMIADAISTGVIKQFPRRFR